MSGRRYCTFDVAQLVIGISIDRVQEVLRSQAITPVPLAHPHVAGLLNLRGHIVTAVDARRRLGLTDRSGGSAPTIVVIRSGGQSASLLVDGAGDVVDVDENRLEALPETVGATFGALAIGAYQLEGHLLVVLDPDETLNVTN
jgi:purine-binding chemotaxis protein CheW